MYTWRMVSRVPVGWVRACCKLCWPKITVVAFSCFLRAPKHHAESAESKTTVVSITIMVFGPYEVSAKRLYRVCKGMAAGTHSEAEHR